jgi:hypothetical protein
MAGNLTAPQRERQPGTPPPVAVLKHVMTVKRNGRPRRAGTQPKLRMTAALALLVMVSTAALSQVGFQIVWVVVGEASTSNGSDPARAGRRLFDGGELASLSLKNVRVTSVAVEPVVSEIRVGDQWCLSSLRMQAFGPQRESIPAAPLSITVRQDHREHIGLQRSRKDICLRPVKPGEYSVRLTSLLPAPDGSMRGAQVFLRVAEHQ